MKNNFYKFLKYKGKPSPAEVSEQYVACYKRQKSLSPFTTKNYMEQLHETTQELKQLVLAIESIGGTAVAGIVSFNNKAVKKFIKNKE